jgi:hypothetical protein
MDFFFPSRAQCSRKVCFYGRTSLHKFLFLLNCALAKEEKPLIGFFASAGTVVPGIIQNGILYNGKMGSWFSQNLPENQGTFRPIHTGIIV